MNRYEIFSWALIISIFTAVICGLVVLWWYLRKLENIKDKIN